MGRSRERVQYVYADEFSDLFYWKDKNGNMHYVKDMPDDYLENCIRHLEKNYSAEYYPLDIAILKRERRYREKIRNTEAGKLLY